MSCARQITASSCFYCRQMFLKHLFHQYHLLFIFFSITYPLSHPISQWVNLQWLQDKVQTLQPSIWEFSQYLSKLNLSSPVLYYGYSEHFSIFTHHAYFSEHLLKLFYVPKVLFPPWHLIHAFIRSTSTIWPPALCQLLSMSAAMTDRVYTLCLKLHSGRWGRK